MNFLLDAHIPPSLARLLRDRGHDVKLCSDLPAGHLSKDRVLNECSICEHRIVVTKDVDFWHSLVLQGRPWKLLLVRTGNLRLNDLLHCFEQKVAEAEASLATGSLYELLPQPR
jgi:predicted nuclease of predicted toxin-antitoxin system